MEINNTMKNKTQIGIILLLLMQLSTTFIFSTKINRLESKIETILGVDELVRNMTTKFDKNINPSTINKITKAISYFNLDTNEKVITMCVAQILTESGGNHYDKRSKDILNGGGAIGVCQILPSTAVGVLSSSSKIRNKVVKFGVTPINFTDDSIPYSERLNLAKKWLSNEKNNIALWGGIMSNTFYYNFDIEKTLIAYNAGVGGLQKYLKKGGEPNKHPYVNKINVLALTLNDRS